MKKPELIIFDYGNTLVTEQDFDPVRGNKALYDSIINKNDVPFDEILAYRSDYLDPAVRKLRAQNIEMRGTVYSRALFAHFGMALPQSDSEIERIFWFNASQGQAVDGAGELLEYLRSVSIRTGVISNMMWSGKALGSRLKRIFPGHEFEFIMTSADHTFRKPDQYMFEAALIQTGIEKEKIWFCGDNPDADIKGAANAGMRPVYFKNDFDSRGYNDKKTSDCEYIEITDLCQIRELISR